MIGFIGVGVLNVLRISVLIITAAWWLDSFETAHDALTHLFPLFAVLPLWLAWMLIAFRRGKSANGDAAGDTPTDSPSSASAAPPAKGE